LTTLPEATLANRTKATKAVQAAGPISKGKSTSPMKGVSPVKSVSPFKSAFKMTPPVRKD
jgi:hypothetical protein